MDEEGRMKGGVRRIERGGWRGPRETGRSVKHKSRLTLRDLSSRDERREKRGTDFASRKESFVNEEPINKLEKSESNLVLFRERLGNSVCTEET